MRLKTIVLFFLTAFAFFGSVQHAIASSSVVIVRPSICSPALLAAATLLKAELLIAGFEVRVVNARPGASPKDEVERIRRWAPGAFATLMMVGTHRGLVADVWVRDHLNAKTTVDSIQVDFHADDSPGDLAIHAAELLRASLVEPSNTQPVPAFQAQAILPPDVAAWSTQRPLTTDLLLELQPAEIPSKLPQATISARQPAPFQPQAPATHLNRYPSKVRPVQRATFSSGNRKLISKAEPSMPVPRHQGFNTPRLDISAALLCSFEGFGSAFMPGLGVSYPIFPDFAAHASFYSTLADSSIKAPEGSAEYQQQLAHLEGIYGFALPNIPLLVSASGGLGGYRLQVKGTGVAPYVGHDETAWALSGQLGAGLSAYVGNRFMIAFETKGLLILPAPMVQIANRNVGGSGLVMMSFSLGLSTALD